MLVADKAKPASGRALAALAEGLLRQRKVAILRMVPRAISVSRRRWQPSPLPLLPPSRSARPPLLKVGDAGVSAGRRSCQRTSTAHPLPPPEQKPALFQASPVGAEPGAPAHLLLNLLPFLEDLRDYKFPSFAKEAW